MHAANKTKETFSAAREQILKVLSFWLTYCYYSKFLKENQKVTLWSKALCENIKQLHDGWFFFPALHIALKNRDTRTGLQRLVIPACICDHQGTILDLDKKVILFSTYPIIPDYDLLKLLPAFSQCFSSQQLSVVVIVDNWSGLELGQPVKINKKSWSWLQRGATHNTL